MTKSQLIVEKVIVTFAEAGLAYLAINQTNVHGDWKVVAVGALGAGLSAVYNLLRESTPTMASVTTPPAAEVPMSGVDELTQPNIVTPGSTSPSQPLAP